MDPLRRFSNRAADYALYRPSYPAEAIDAILHGLGPPESLRCADVGAGTGISARLFADRGVQVVAIEPNQAMIDAAERHTNVDWRQGTAEDTGLEDESVDLVTCFQSFHWFDHERALPEFRRILKPGGRLALVWNDRDRSDAVSDAYSAVVKGASGDHPAERARREATDEVRDSGHFEWVEVQTFENAQRLNLEGLIGRAESSSYVPREGPENETMRAELRRVWEEHRDGEGFVVMGYVTNVYLARPGTKLSTDETD
jgi:SAM-dependent methyltransferase